MKNPWSKSTEKIPYRDEPAYIGRKAEYTHLSDKEIQALFGGEPGIPGMVLKQDLAGMKKAVLSMVDPSAVASCTTIQEFLRVVLPNPQAVSGPVGKALQKSTGLSAQALEWIADPYFDGDGNPPVDILKNTISL